jgi:hypothetical protein
MAIHFAALRACVQKVPRADFRAASRSVEAAVNLVVSSERSAWAAASFAAHASQFSTES